MMDNQGVYILDGYVPFMGLREFLVSIKDTFQDSLDYIERKGRDLARRLIT